LTIRILLLSILFVVLSLLSLLTGSVWISPSEIYEALTNPQLNVVNHFIFTQLRLSKTIAAIVVGMGLPISGLMMQTLYRNPLAGPFVLGISSGASLGVALFVFAGSSLLALSPWLLSLGLGFFAILGAFLVMLLVLTVSISIRNSASLLVVGIMVGSLSTALVSVMQYYSSPQLLQRFVVWTFGSLGGIHWNEIIVMTLVVSFSIVFSFGLMKSMNALMINEDYAKGLGIKVNYLKIKMIVLSSLMAGIITAYAGPIAFIGVAIPHLARNFIHTSDHRKTLPIVLLLGSNMMLICDLISQLPGGTTVLPINSVTALFGAPIVIWIVIKNRSFLNS